MSTDFLLWKIRNYLFYIYNPPPNPQTGYITILVELIFRIYILYIYNYICYLQLSQIVYYNSIISLNNSPSPELIVNSFFSFVLCSWCLSQIHIKTLPESYIASQYILTRFFQYPSNLLWHYHSYSHSSS